MLGSSATTSAGSACTVSLEEELELLGVGDDTDPSFAVAAPEVPDTDPLEFDRVAPEAEDVLLLAAVLEEDCELAADCAGCWLALELGCSLGTLLGTTWDELLDEGDAVLSSSELVPADDSLDGTLALLELVMCDDDAGELARLCAVEDDSSVSNGVVLSESVAKLLISNRTTMQPTRMRCFLMNSFMGNTPF